MLLLKKGQKVNQINSCFLNVSTTRNVPRTSSSVHLVLEDGFTPDWRTTEARPSSRSLSREANLGSNVEHQRSSLNEKTV